ncbi:hypothetical protein [Streptomyces paludis]|uniref:Secreted protein n=1 Tax=Streptomyces paludis TaxID=2282738 RepID=A0A345HMT4_9ACTN|nr:hypothetical protein [Streptomyces paludis]AXG78008.1 hypothetical protein DVK44_10130 [Streptomyces paludis]
MKAPTRTGLVHTTAWLLATGAAVTLSWWGVHTVMAGTAYDPPRALPLPAGSAPERSAEPAASSTRRAESPAAKRTRADGPGTESPAGGGSDSGSGSGSGSSASDPPGPSPSAPAPEPSRTSERTGGGTESAAGGQVKSYTVDGGRVALDLGESSAELVSATPEAGWRMQVWTEPYWIRVTFTLDGREVSVFCTWYNHPPLVEFDDR